jgi:hypothetical protein
MNQPYVKKAWLILFIIVFSTTLFAAYADSSRGLTQVEPPAKVPLPEDQHKPAQLSKHIVEYHINVELLAEAKKLQGQQTLTWTNPGKKPVNELYFHLYPNAFSSKKTTFNRESGGKLREDSMTKDSFGGIELASIQTEDGTDLFSRMEYVQPDDGNQHDQTLLKVRLFEPVKPGEDITLHMEFAVRLPQVFARMGYVGDFVMAGQWFPKIAVYEPAGLRDRKEEGWNLHQYHGNSEFYADFGIYNVRIKVPQDYIVAATGFPVSKAVTEGNKKTYHFYADDVHDFSWSASPHFVYAEQPFSTPDIPGVRIKLYLDPKQAHLKERYFYAAKKSLARYSEWYGSYPYSTLSIVVPPEGGNGAGGMEYPTLITAWAASEESPGYELERVVVHEIGHQYWYGIVANNEFEEAWLDEGLTSYAEDKFMESEYGIAPNLPVESSYITSPAPLKHNSWQYRDHSEYADNVYMRAKLVLKGIEREIGEKQMNKVLKTYFQQWKFKHPTTRDFQKTLEKVTGRSWGTFFNQYVYNGLMVDYAVESIQVKPIHQEESTTYENIISIKKYGGSHAKVPLLFHFTDGTSLRKEWNGADDRIQFKLIHKTPVDWAAIDPEYTIVLENKHINNFMKTSVENKISVRWNIGTVKLIEALIGWVAW